MVIAPTINLINQVSVHVLVLGVTLKVPKFLSAVLHARVCCKPYIFGISKGSIPFIRHIKKSLYYPLVVLKHIFVCGTVVFRLTVYRGSFCFTVSSVPISYFFIHGLHWLIISPLPPAPSIRGWRPAGYQ